MIQKLIQRYLDRQDAEYSFGRTFTTVFEACILTESTGKLDHWAYIGQGIIFAAQLGTSGRLQSFFFTWNGMYSVIGDLFRWFIYKELKLVSCFSQPTWGIRQIWTLGVLISGKNLGTSVIWCPYIQPKTAFHFKIRPTNANDRKPQHLWLLSKRFKYASLIN